MDRLASRHWKYHRQSDRRFFAGSYWPQACYVWAGCTIFGRILNCIFILNQLFLYYFFQCFWILSFFAQSVEYLYVGRLLAGITGGGGYIVLPIFISEISDAKCVKPYLKVFNRSIISSLFFRTRGRLGSMIMVSVNTGVLVGYILATNVDYFMAPLFIIPLPICYIVGNLFLPETPFFLIRNGKFDAAEKSFRFYKNIKQTDKTSMVEFDDIKQALTHEENSKNYTFQDFSKFF